MSPVADLDRLGGGQFGVSRDVVSCLNFTFIIPVSVINGRSRLDGPMTHIPSIGGGDFLVFGAGGNCVGRHCFDDRVTVSRER